jgi:S1-C subfamily serine protease
VHPLTDAESGIEVARCGRRWRRALPFAAGATAMLVVVLASAALRPDATSLTRSDVDEAVASALASLETEPAASERAYRAVAASIVLIETTATPTSEDVDDGKGTGVVVNDRGDVLTALHVVAGAASIRLTFADGSRRLGIVASADSDTDIAVVRPDTPPDTAAAATLGNPRSLRVGSEAYVVANPLGLYRSLSAGVVSALDRAFRDPDTGTVRDGLIQVDAAVNPGSSGGPLLDRDGRVVGIVTALVNPTDQEVFIGVGLAVPIDVAGGGARGFPQY